MIRKKKISELPLAQSPSKLFLLGVDAGNKSVKFSLEDLISISEDKEREMIREEIGKAKITIKKQSI